MRNFLSSVWCYFFHGNHYQITVLDDDTYKIACQKCGKEWET